MIRSGLLAMLFLAAFLHADSSMYKGSPQRLGYANANLGAPVHLAWKDLNEHGEFYSSPAVVDGIVYLGNDNHDVYAFELKTAGLKWKQTLPERVYGSSPQVVDGKLYIACVNGCIEILDAETGALLQEICVKKEGMFGDGPDILGSPLVDAGNLYFGSDNHFMYCFKLPEGTQRWSFETDDKIHDAAATLDGQRVYFGSSDGYLYALDKDSGQLAWKSSSFDKLNTTPMVYGGKVYFGAGDDSLHCLDAQSGQEQWSFKTPKGIMSSPSINALGTRLVFGGADGDVYCLDMKGQLVWKFKTGGPVLASPLITGETVWIGSFDGFFYALDLAHGTRIFSYKTQDGIFSTAAAADGKIVVGGKDGGIYCFAATSK